jgi:8-oxo-dGTP diphosphatase
MNLIAKLTDKEVFGKDVNYSDRKFSYREAARAIISNDEGKIALMHISKSGFYKLPGGGVKPGEDIETALRREAREEVGCDIKISDEVGQLLEVRLAPDQSTGLIHLTYCYHAEVVGEIVEPQLEDDEKQRGTQLIWVSIEEAKEKINSYTGDEYEVKFIVARDKLLFKAALS